MQTITALKSLIVVTLAIIVTSCSFITQTRENIKQARENSKSFSDDLIKSRSIIYEKVGEIKKSNLSNNKKEELKKQYELVAKSFNDVYDGIVKKLPDDVISQGKCAVLKYGSVVQPSNSSLIKASKDADNFLIESSKALTPAGTQVGVIGIAQTILELIEFAQKKNLEFCVQNINGLKYKSWDEI